MKLEVIYISILNLLVVIAVSATAVFAIVTTIQYFQLIGYNNDDPRMNGLLIGLIKLEVLKANMYYYFLSVPAVIYILVKTRLEQGAVIKKSLIYFAMLLAFIFLSVV